MLAAIGASLTACRDQPPTSPAPYLDPADSTAVVHAFLLRYEEKRPVALDTVAFSAYTGRDLPTLPASAPAFPSDSTLLLSATWPTYSTDCVTDPRGITTCPAWSHSAFTYRVAALRSAFVIERKRYDGDDARAEAALYGPDGEERWRTPFPSYLRSITLYGTTLFAIDDVLTRRFENTVMYPRGSADSLVVHRYELGFDSLTAAPPVTYPLDPPSAVHEAYIVLPND